MECSDMFELARASKVVWRLSAVLMMSAALSACSSVPDWVNPGTWIGSSDSQSASSGADAGSDQAGATGSQGQTVAEASDQYPALADTPDKAPPSTSTDEQKQVAGALVADRTQAQYSAEALRAGTEPAAAPPGAASAESASLPPPASTVSVGPPTADSDVNANPDAAAQSASAAPSGPAAMPGTLPSEAHTPTASPGGTRVASTPAVATGPMPAPAAPSPSAAATAQIAPTDAALGFQPSHAPPLDPQVGQLASPAGHVRQRQLAAANPVATAAPPLSGPAGAPAATVVFAAEANTLDDAARAQVRAAVAAYRSTGAQGYVRVVGHAPGVSNSERQMVSAFSRSQACADAVARELIKQGVPAGQVLVDAVGDSGGDGGRRAEIFLQS
jgi:outer membrane protein OmpA-like peptidoglycan-associated protein